MSSRHASFPDKIKSLVSAASYLSTFLVADVLTASPRFTFGGVNIVISALLAGVSLLVILHTAWQMRMKRTTLNPLHAHKSTTLVTDGCYARAATRSTLV